MGASVDREGTFRQWRRILQEARAQFRRRHSARFSLSKQPVSAAGDPSVQAIACPPGNHLEQLKCSPRASQIAKKPEQCVAFCVATGRFDPNDTLEARQSIMLELGTSVGRLLGREEKVFLPIVSNNKLDGVVAQIANPIKEQHWKMIRIRHMYPF